MTLLIVIVAMFVIYIATPRFIGYSVLAAYESMFFLSGVNPFDGEPLGAGMKIFSFALFALFLWLAIKDYSERREKKAS